MGNDDGKLPLSGRRDCKIVAPGVALSVLHDQMFRPGALFPNGMERSIKNFASVWYCSQKADPMGSRFRCSLVKLILITPVSPFLT